MKEKIESLYKEYKELTNLNIIEKNKIQNIAKSIEEREREIISIKNDIQKELESEGLDKFTIDNAKFNLRLYTNIVIDEKILDSEYIKTEIIQTKKRIILKNIIKEKLKNNIFIKGVSTNKKKLLSITPIKNK